MNNYAENDTFSFGGDDNMFLPNTPGTTNLDSSQNEALFNNEVSNSIIENSMQLSENSNNPVSINEDIFSIPANPFIVSNSQQVLANTKESIANAGVSNQSNLYMQMPDVNSNKLVTENTTQNTQKLQQEFQVNPILGMSLNASGENKDNEILGQNIPSQIQKNETSVEQGGVSPQQEVSENVISFDENQKTPQEFSENTFPFTNMPVDLEIPPRSEVITNSFANMPNESPTDKLSENTNITSSEAQNIELDSQSDLQEQSELNTEEENVPSLEPETISMADSNLDELTSFKEEEAVKTTDIKSLFDRVGINVKEASDIFKRNTEMKEKIDSRFEELKKLQSEVSKVKKAQYDEINAYKEDVLGKLTSKKDEIESRLNKLKEFQKSLEKEKADFEQYRKSQKEEIERIQKEVQEAYDNRREELKRIEDILRKQKDSLDEERNQLNLDKIQYESDKNELANNLLKFNEIVDSFTTGIDKIEEE